MSRPYININSISFTAPVLTMNWSYFRNRANGSYTIAGLSNSIAFSETLANNNLETLTFSVAALGLPADPLSSFVDPSPIVYNFSGTTSNTSNVKIKFNGVQITSTTASGVTLSVFLQSLASNFNSSAPSSFSALAVTNAATGSLTITTTNTGNYYNGASFSVISTVGGGTLGYNSKLGTSSGTVSYTGGLTNYNMVLTYAGLGGNDSIVFTS